MPSPAELDVTVGCQYCWCCRNRRCWAWFSADPADIKHRAIARRYSQDNQTITMIQLAQYYCRNETQSPDSWSSRQFDRAFKIRWQWENAAHAEETQLTMIRINLECYVSRITDQWGNHHLEMKVFCMIRLMDSQLMQKNHCLHIHWKKKKTRLEACNGVKHQISPSPTIPNMGNFAIWTSLSSLNFIQFSKHIRTILQVD